MSLLTGLLLVKSHRSTPAIIISVVAELRSVAEEEEVSGLNWYMVCSRSLVADATIFLATFLASQDSQLSGAFTPATLKYPDSECSPAAIAVWVIKSSMNTILSLVLG